MEIFHVLTTSRLTQRLPGIVDSPPSFLSDPEIFGIKVHGFWVFEDPTVLLWGLNECNQRYIPLHKVGIRRLPGPPCANMYVLHDLRNF